MSPETLQTVHFHKISKPRNYGILCSSLFFEKIKPLAILAIHHRSLIGSLVNLCKYHHFLPLRRIQWQFHSVCVVTELGKRKIKTYGWPFLSSLAFHQEDHNPTIIHQIMRNYSQSKIIVQNYYKNFLKMKQNIAESK